MERLEYDLETAGSTESEGLHLVTTGSREDPNECLFGKEESSGIAFYARGAFRGGRDRGRSSYDKGL